jgi:hypothetical protein
VYQAGSVLFWIPAFPAPRPKPFVVNVREWLLQQIAKEEKKEIEAIDKEIEDAAKASGFQDDLDLLGAALDDKGKRGDEARRVLDPLLEKRARVEKKHEAARALAAEIAKKWFDKHKASRIDLRDGTPAKTTQEEVWGAIHEPGEAQAVLMENTGAVWNKTTLKKLGAETIGGSYTVIGSTLGLSGGAAVSFTKWAGNVAVEKVAEEIASKLGELVAAVSSEGADAIDLDGAVKRILGE